MVPYIPCGRQASICELHISDEVPVVSKAGALISSEHRRKPYLMAGKSRRNWGIKIFRFSIKMSTFQVKPQSHICSPLGVLNLAQKTSRDNTLAVV